MADEPERETAGEEKKLPLSGVGIASFVLAALSLAGLAYAIFGTSSDFTGLVGPGGGFGLMVAFFLGVNSIIRVSRRTASLWSLFFAIPPVLVPGILLVVGSLWFQDAMTQAWCGHHLRDLANDILVYSQDNNEKYPDPNKWCDLLIEKADADKHNFRCRRDKIGPCSYAMNPNGLCSSSPSSMVELFEAKPGWNQHGGPELLDPSRHTPRGCYVLFNDMHTEFVAEKDLPNLRWTKEQKWHPGALP
jgi:hypothetical protein